MVVTSLFVFLIKHSPNFCVAKKIHLSILLAVFNGSCAQSVPAHTRWNGAYDQNVYFASKQTNEKRVLANHNTPLPVYVGTKYFDLKNQHNWQPYHYQISNKTTGKKHPKPLEGKGGRYLPRKKTATKPPRRNDRDKSYHSPVHRAGAQRHPSSRTHTIRAGPMVTHR